MDDIYIWGADRGRVYAVRRDAPTGASTVRRILRCRFNPQPGEEGLMRIVPFDSSGGLAIAVRSADEIRYSANAHIPQMIWKNYGPDQHYGHEKETERRPM